MSPEVTAAWIAAGVGVLTVVATAVTQDLSRRATGRGTDRLFAEQRGQQTKAFTGSPNVVAAGVAGAAVDCGGGVPALLGGEEFGLGECTGQVGAQLGVRLLEGGDAFDLAAEGSLLLCRRHRYGRRLPAVSNGRERR